MIHDDPNDLQDSDSDGSDDQPIQPLNSKPSDDIQAPESGWFNKGVDSDSIPNDKIEAPKSRWFLGGISDEKAEPSDE